MHEFDCQHCGIRVIMIVADPHPENIYCMECRFVEGIEDPRTREEFREYFDRKRSELGDDDWQDCGGEG